MSADCWDLQMETHLVDRLVECSDLLSAAQSVATMVDVWAVLTELKTVE